MKPMDALRKERFRSLALAVALVLTTCQTFGQVISSTPDMLKDTARLCLGSDNKISFSASGTANQSFTWKFDNGSPKSLTGSGPVTVSYSTAGVFEVAVYIFDSGLPSDTLYRYVEVGQPQSVSFVPSDSSFCTTDAPFTLNGHSPAGGSFRGPGVSGGKFYPSMAGTGSHSLWYVYHSGSCADSASVLMEVQSANRPDLQAQGTPTIFNGKKTYTRCVPASSIFNFYTTTASSQYTSYSIDFGDGQTQTGTTFPSPYLSHSYAKTGIFDAVLSVTNANGCVSSDTIRLFYGSNPSVGLSIKGNNIKCLPRDSSGHTFAFPISNTGSNPPGTVYIVEVNDGSPTQYYSHPPPDSILHTFYEPSCGYNTVNFKNAFQVKITASTPCQPNSVATVEPIFISDPPTAAFSVEPRVCFGKPVTISDESWGSENALTGCDTNVTLVWEVSPSTYTVKSGFEGSLMGSGNPMNWLSGTENLTVNFLKTGYYTIRQYVGNQAGCEIDTVVKIVCVDSIPNPDFAVDKDTFCSPDTVHAHFLHNLISFCDTMGLRWTVTPATGYRFTGSPTDSATSIYFYRSGNYTVSVESSNLCDTSTAVHNITVLGAPDVRFPADADFCGTTSVDFSQARYRPTVHDSLAPVSHNWQVLPASGWNFASGNAASANPVIDFQNFGSYKVIYTATNTCGADSDTIELQFFEKPELTVPADTLVCYGATASRSFTATKGTPPYSYEWRIKGAKKKNKGNTVVVNNLTSTTTINLTVADANGCEDTTSFRFLVTGELMADAGPNQRICYYDTTQLNASASGGAPGYTYRWTPGTGLSDSTVANPLKFPTGGSMTYTLEVTDSLGCSGTDEVDIEIFPLVNLTAGNDLALCYDSTLHVMNDHFPQGGSWSGPGLTDSTFDPIAAGLGVHTLLYYYQDEHGCEYYDSLEVNVINVPEARFSLSAAGCTPLNVQVYDSSSAGVNHYWYIDDSLASTSIQPNFNLVNSSLTTVRRVKVKLVVAAGSGCRDSAEHSIDIYPGPKARFGRPAASCGNDTLPIHENSIYGGSASYKWILNSSLASLSNDTLREPFIILGDNHTGTDSLYELQLVLTTSNGCTDTASRNLWIYSRPIADFRLPANTCSPSTLAPADSSTGNNLSYSWSINPPVSISGGNTSSPAFQLPLSTNDSVAYDISLQITDDRGCIDTISKTYWVYPQPTAAFTTTVTDSCGPLSLRFNNQSSSNLPGQHLRDLSFEWDFGNGQISSDSVPTATFTNTGISDSSYLVSLKVTSQFGCTDSTSQTISVHPDPIAEIDFNFVPGCAPYTVDQSQASAVEYKDANDLYIWRILNLGGNLLSSDTGSAALDYIIKQPGDSILVQLVVTSPYGCKSDTDQVLMYSLPDPLAAFTASPSLGCSPLFVQLGDSSSAGVTHKWYMNGQLFSSQPQPSLNLVNNSPVNDSIVSILLAVTSPDGCTDSIEKQVRIKPVPVAGFGVTAAMCPADTAWSSNTSSAAAGSHYVWSVSSSIVEISNDTAAAPYFVFPDNQSGKDSTYSIQLVVTSPFGCRDSITKQVKIFNRPVAGFAMPAPACGPQVINPIDTASGKQLSYQWKVSPAINIQGANHHTPTFEFPVSYSDSVTYQITQIVSNKEGCLDSAVGSYTVYPMPTAGFTASAPDTCGPVSISFSNSSFSGQSGMDRSTMNFSWDFGNGLTSTDPVPSVSFTNTSTTDSSFVIRLIATNAFGCADTAFDTITLHPAPVANISFSQAASCAPFTLDSSVVNAQILSMVNDSYYWEVINSAGTIVAQDSGVKNLSYTITQAGDSVRVRLTATSIYGCESDTSIQLFYTWPNPVADFTPVPASSCSPLRMTVADSSSPGSKEWYVNDSLYHTGPNPTFVLINPSATRDSVVSVKLVVTSANGCRDSLVRTVTIHPNPVARFELAGSSCPEATVYAMDSSLAKAGSTYRWSVSGSMLSLSSDTAVNPGIQVGANQSGFDSSFVVKLVVTSPDGCADSTQRILKVFSRPVASFSMPAAACSPVTANPIDASTGNNLAYQWSVSPAISIQGAAHHTPTFDFPVSFSDSVQYQVTLLLTDSITGCSDTLTKSYTVYPRPTAAFAPSKPDSCGPHVITFYNQSSPNQSGMDRRDMSFAWDFGNGKTSTDSVPTVTFTNTGTTDSTFVVRLIASNAFGCADTAFDTITVHPSPRAVMSFSQTMACTPFTIDSSVVSAQVIAFANDRYYWEVLDKNGLIVAQDSALSGLSYTLTQPQDSVYVRLTATSPFGCVADTSIQLFYTIDNPAAGFTPLPQQGCSPLTVTVADSAEPGASRSWYVNDSLVQTGLNPVFNFINTSHTQDTSITIKLVVEAGTGCKDSSSQQVVVHPSPAAGFSMADSLCPSAVVVPVDSSISKPGYSYRWSVNSAAVQIDNDSLAAPQFSFPDNQSGYDSIYTVSLVITSVDGCSDSTTRQVRIYARPEAKFSMPAAACSPVTANPIDASTGNNLAYQWSVSPAISIQGAAHHTPTFDFPVSFSDSVQYQVTLLLTDSITGCSDTLTKSYTVYPRPTAAFAPSKPDSCGPHVITFYNQSSPNQTGMDRRDMSFAWDFGNGKTSTDSVPTVTFTNTGTTDSTFVVRLIASNAFGCADTAFDTITVHPSPRAVMSFSQTMACTPFTIDSSVVSAQVIAFANDRYYWEVLDKNGLIVAQDSALSGLSYTLTQPQDSVYVRLTATSPFGCVADTSIQLFYTIDNPAAGFTPLPQQGCSPLTVTVADSAEPGASRSWYVNDSLVQTGLNPVFNFINTSHTQDTSITIKLVVEAGTGCKDSSSQQVVVHPSPAAGFSMADSLCPSAVVVPVDSSISKPGYSYRWSVNSTAVQIDNDSLAAPQFHFPDNQSGYDSIYTLSLVITSVDGCSDSTSRQVRIYSRPEVDFNIPRNSCGPVSFGPIDQSKGRKLKYRWSVQPPVPVSGAQSKNPVFDFPVSTSDSVEYRIQLFLTDSVTGCSDTLSKKFSVMPKPTAGFTATPKDSCGPLSISFGNTSTPNQSGMDISSMSFIWDFGNGQTSVAANPTTTFTNTGTIDSVYLVQLIATNAFGCSNSVVDSITVHPDPRVDFLANPLRSCAPFVIDTNVVSYTDYPAANSNYKFQFLDIHTDSVLASYMRYDSLHYLLPVPGDSVKFRMIAFSPFGCKSDTGEVIFSTVGRAPIGFTASASEGCHPLVVSLADTGNGFSSWEWSVDGQLVSNLQNPTLSFTNTSSTYDSIYTVKLIAQAGNGCPDSIIQKIRVYAQLAPDWNTANECFGDSLYFQNLTPMQDSVASWYWDFGDGQSDSSASPAHSYSSAGTYVVSLTATSIHGCSYSYSDTVVQYPLPVAYFGIDNSCGMDSACVNQPVAFFDSSNVATLGGNLVQWEWDMTNDGSIDYTATNPTHTFTSAGTYQVRLITTSNFGCTDTLIRNIYIYEPPQAYFAIDSLDPCGPVNATVTDSSSGLIRSYYWELFTKTPTGQRVSLFTSTQPNPGTLPTLIPKWGADTTYYVELTVANCCGFTTHLDSVIMKPMPIAHTVPSSSQGCTPFTTTFQLDGLVKGSPDFLVMDYGDGSPADTIYRFFQINPVGDTIWVWGQQSHKFVNNGLHDTTFQVALSAVNVCGDSTVYTSITVHPNNVQAFIEATPEFGCAPLTVTLIDRSYGGTSTSWCLNYDTATGACNMPSAVGDSIVYTYTQPGTYVVAQFVNDICSGDTAYRTITVYPSPQANFSQSGNVCMGEPVLFTNLSQADSITGYTWNFGDGQQSILKHPAHMYNSPGTYAVQLQVMSKNGCGSQHWDTVEVYDIPKMDFSTESACLNQQPIHFYDSSSVQHGYIVSTFWDFGDGNTSVSANPQHTYSQAGVYTVKLIHSSTSGCTDSVEKTLQIYPIADADFTPQRVSAGKNCGAPQMYSFTNNSKNAAGYYWDFDYNGVRGANTSTLNNPNFLYAKSGVYDVLLVATNMYGCADTMMKTVMVRPVPKAGFEADNVLGCAPLTVHFTDTSVYDFNGPGGITNWTWSFGDSTFAYDSASVTHTYTKPGTYSVSLLVESDGGCFDSIVLNNYITVLPTPVPDFTSKSVNSKTIRFTNLTKYADDNTAFIWDFGDGKVSTERHPVHNYGVDLFQKDYQFEVCLVALNLNGCGDTICRKVNLRGYQLYTANAFAPGLNGVGDASIWRPLGHSLKEYHLRIYDEWGNMVFESTELDESGKPSESWDGRHIANGTELPMGAYVWVIDAVYDDGTIWPGVEYENGKRKNYGTVTLIR